MGARKTMGRDKNVQLAQDTCPRYFAALLLGYYCVIYRVITALLPPYFRAIAAFLPRYYCVIRVISARQRNFCISNCSCLSILGRAFIAGSTGVSVNQLSPRSRNKLSLHSAGILRVLTLIVPRITRKLCCYSKREICICYIIYVLKPFSSITVKISIETCNIREILSFVIIFT